MSEAYFRCVPCGGDTRFGDRHCPLCHENYPKGADHSCSAIDEAIADAKPEVAVFVNAKGRRDLWPAQTYAEHELVLE